MSSVCPVLSMIGSRLHFAIAFFGLDSWINHEVKFSFNCEMSQELLYLIFYFLFFTFTPSHFIEKKSFSAEKKRYRKIK